MVGNPLAPELRAALDSPNYRSRRIVLPLVAHLLGLGRWRAGGFRRTALSGLIRETSVLCAAAFALPRPGDRRGWIRATGPVAAAVLPAALWMAIVYAHHHVGGGTRNVSLPLVGLHGKLVELAADLKAHRFDASVRGELLAVIALATQVAFVFARPASDRLWWRVGVVFAHAASPS